MFVGTGKPRKPAQRAEARRLRKEHGLPYKRIAAKLGVSASSVFHWTRDIAITDAQRRRNLIHMTPRSEVVMKRAATWRAINRERRLAFQREGRKQAREGDPFHMAGCMLYWAEGAKERNTARFVNSDENMLSFFRRFLAECLGVEPADVRIRLNVYLGNGLTIEEIESHWLEALQLPRSCLRGHSLNHLPTSSSGKKKNRLPYGVCSLIVNSTRIVQHIYGAIQEYAGFDEPGWLDGPQRKPRKQPAAANA